jgi:predicted RNA methylase
MLADIEDIRRNTSSTLDQKTRSRLGQFFTPLGIARFMASLFRVGEKANISVLDAGAGIGSLSAAFLESVMDSEVKKIHVTAYEVDKKLAAILHSGLESYESYCREGGKELTVEIINEDFIEHAVFGLCASTNRQFDYAILNPPYHKINSNSTHRHLLRKVRIETVNLYSAFVALSLKLLVPGGQMAVIIPRSFCNGPYYKPFRYFLLSQAAIEHIHLFESRDKAFGEDGVLQENIILHLVKGAEQGDVTISTSSDGQFSNYQEWSIPFAEVVKRNDEERFIHVPYHQGKSVLNQSEAICHSLEEIGCAVSTGPVVDFRAKDYLRKMPGQQTAPLIYPAHFNGWTIHYPLPDFKKYNAIEVNDETARQLYPSGYYTIVRRFSSKEEKRRIVARVIRLEDIDGDFVGFENHLNVFHCDKQGLPEELAFGLATYLNSKAVDEYFRLFSGHTQVNATDLRNLMYPSREILVELGKWAKKQQDFNLQVIDTQITGIL